MSNYGLFDDTLTRAFGAGLYSIRDDIAGVSPKPPLGFYILTEAGEIMETETVGAMLLEQS
jgi:hypothetical protein